MLFVMLTKLLRDESEIILKTVIRRSSSTGIQSAYKYIYIHSQGENKLVNNFGLYEDCHPNMRSYRTIVLIGYR